MRLEPSDPDIETVVTRITRNDLNLQPEFQRGEVWSQAKRQRLIDSILRDWHIPPIHVIEITRSRQQEVLDGQQRLAAIRDFVHNEFPVDGSIEPVSDELRALHGMKFHQLPDEWKRRVYQFTLRVFRVLDYKPDEPGELFFRLNQPTSLTAAEQRNAFFGPVREQIKVLVAELETGQKDIGLLGFSNHRMAYDDLLARVCFSVENGSITTKVTAAALIELYRRTEPLADDTIARTKRAVSTLSDVNLSLDTDYRLSKATAYSWLIFLVRAESWNEEIKRDPLSAFMRWFSEQRANADNDISISWAGLPLDGDLLRTFGDRATARVADVSSVILRDAVLWMAYETFVSLNSPTQERRACSGLFEKLRLIRVSFNSRLEHDEFARALIEHNWGVV